MKKPGKLEINSEKLMKNEELVTLKGGYGQCQCWCLHTLTGQKIIYGGEGLNYTYCSDMCTPLGYNTEWNCLN